MANLLQDLAMGLRSAGGVISPQVYKEISDENQQENQLRKQLAIQQYQQNIKDQRERALGDAIRPKLESGDIEGAAAAAASTPGGFQTGMSLLGQAETRRARIDQLRVTAEQRAQDLQVRHQQRMDELAQRGADQAALAAANRDHQAQMAQLQRQQQVAMARLVASLRPERQNPIVQTNQGIFERTPQGLVPLKSADGTTLMPPKSGEVKPMTEFQGKNMLFGTRSAEAHNVLNNLEDKVTFTSLWAKQKMGAAGRASMTESERMMDQAQRNFVNAVLRQESGAVISDPEFKNAQIQYFPQPGDDAKTLEQKRQNRETAINGFQKIAGPGGDDIAAIRERGKKMPGATGEWSIKPKGQ